MQWIIEAATVGAGCARAGMRCDPGNKTTKNQSQRDPSPITITQNVLCTDECLPPCLLVAHGSWQFIIYWVNSCCDWTIRMCANGRTCLPLTLLTARVNEILVPQVVQTWMHVLHITFKSACKSFENLTASTKMPTTPWKVRGTWWFVEIGGIPTQETSAVIIKFFRVLTSVKYEFVRLR